jgi:hypothetical protein
LFMEMMSDRQIEIISWLPGEQEFKVPQNCRAVSNNGKKVKHYIIMFWINFQ